MFDLPQIETVELSPRIVHEVVVDSRDGVSWDTSLSKIATGHLSTMSDEALDEDWRLNDFFGTIMVINLPRSKERLTQITQELYGINTHTFNVFPAIDGRKELPPSIWQKIQQNRERYDIKTVEGRASLDRLHQGEAGCYMSHYMIIRKMKEAFDHALVDFKAATEKGDEETIKIANEKLRKYSSVLILEDDVCFGIVERNGNISKNGTGRILREALLALPDDWGILYFVVRPTQRTSEVSPHLRKIKKSFCLMAYAISHRMYEPLINVLEKIEDPNVTSVFAVDNEIGAIQSKHEVYAINPSIAFGQEGGASEITGATNLSLCQPQPFAGREK